MLNGSRCWSASVFDLQEVKDTKSKGVTLHLVRPGKIQSKPGTSDLQHTEKPEWGNFGVMDFDEKTEKIDEHQILIHTKLMCSLPKNAPIYTCVYMYTYVYMYMVIQCIISAAQAMAPHALTKWFEAIFPSHQECSINTI